MCKLVITQERLKIEVKLLLSANKKSYTLHRLTQQRMTLSDLEWPFNVSRAISAVAGLLVFNLALVRMVVNTNARSLNVELP